MDRFLKKKDLEKTSYENSEKSTKKLKALQKYRPAYSKEWPCLIESSVSNEHVFCSICCRDFSVAHGGRDDCRRHIDTTLHKDNVKRKSSIKNISTFVIKQDEEDEVTKAELLFTTFLMEHNLPLSCSDHAGQLFRKMFPDSKIAKKYGCARTKTSAILKSLAATTQDDISKVLIAKPFTLATDGSNDNNDVKLYPLVVTYFCESKNKVISMILSLLECSDNTGAGIFQVIDNEFRKRNIPWKNCVAFASDNANTMSGPNKGVISFIRSTQPTIHFQGCVCHLLHLAAKKGSEAIEQFNMEAFLVDIYYYLQNSSKRQHNFQLCQSIFGVKPHKILKYISTRWLSMYNSIERVLEQWDPLTKYFSDDNFVSKNDNSRYMKIRARFQDPISKAYLLFMRNILPLFINSNTYLQNEKPLIHKLHKVINDLFMNLVTRFIKPCAIDDDVITSCLENIDFSKKKNQKSDSDLVIGSETRSHLKGIDSDEIQKFYNDVRKFYLSSIEYIKKKLPVGDKDLFIKHATIADISLRKKKEYSSIEFLISKFPYLLSDEDKTLLEVEFCNYQFEKFDDFDIQNERADILWYKISEITDGLGNKKYVALPKLILGLLLVPHSNAASERLFSIVRRNQTDFRPTLGTDVLASLIIEKQKNVTESKKCYEMKFSNAQIKAAKKATWDSLSLKQPTLNSVSGPSTSGAATENLF